MDRPVPATDSTVNCTYPSTSENPKVWHIKAVADVQEDVAQLATFPSIPVLTVWSETPKLRPDMVTEEEPDNAILRCIPDAAAVSKLKMGLPVPGTAATVTLTVFMKSPNAFDRHANVVADVHDDVKHAPRSPRPPRSSPAVAVCSPTPKSSPDTVTDAYPLGGAFSSTSDARAASKLNTGRPVPDTPATVTLADRNKSPNAFDRHASVVADVQDDVKHAPRSPPPPRSSPAETVNSLIPKFSPETVSDAYPLCGAFCCTFDVTAASKLKMDRPVPATDSTVNCMYPNPAKKLGT